jgi:hypothetical protein
LRVDPDVLQSAGTAFGEIVDSLTSMQADTPLADAAAGVGDLQIASACRQAQEGVAAAAQAAIDSVRKFGGNLSSAARMYQGHDASAAAEIDKVDIPK